MKKLDDVHYSFREVDGYNKPFTFVMSPREPGKTTMAWLKKIYLPWKKTKKPWIYLVRNVVEITDALINSIAGTIINKFTDDEVELKFSKSTFKDGIVDVFIGTDLFFRIVALSIQLRRIKLAVLKNVGGVLMDEYIIDPKTGEKYIKEEAFKIKEAYTTWRRESDDTLRMLFLANPYSLYNPLFLDWGVDLNRLKRGSFYIGETFVIHWAELTPELKSYLLAKNPLYRFDDSYQKYAVEGVAANDANIPLSAQPDRYSMQFVFRIGDKYLGAFKHISGFWWVGFTDSVSWRRSVICFDFDDLGKGCRLLSIRDKLRLQGLKDAVARRMVEYADVNAFYLMREVYNHI